MQGSQAWWQIITVWHPHTVPRTSPPPRGRESRVREAPPSPRSCARGWGGVLAAGGGRPLWPGDATASKSLENNSPKPFLQVLGEALGTVCLSEGEQIRAELPANGSARHMGRLWGSAALPLGEWGNLPRVPATRDPRRPSRRQRRASPRSRGAMARPWVASSVDFPGGEAGKVLQEPERMGEGGLASQAHGRAVPRPVPADRTDGPPQGTGVGRQAPCPRGDSGVGMRVRWRAQLKCASEACSPRT